ncbi:MAG: hypothetical protein U9N59_00075 [Campylobacterota bacterium]|nr:hypothetical protein [Campylobacterota bacterium]
MEIVFLIIIVWVVYFLYSASNNKKRIINNYIRDGYVKMNQSVPISMSIASYRSFMKNNSYKIMKNDNKHIIFEYIMPDNTRVFVKVQDTAYEHSANERLRMVVSNDKKIVEQNVYN